MNAADIIERLARLEQERRDLAADMAEIRKEAKSFGLDVKAINLAVKRRLETDAQRQERERIEAEAELYEAAAKTSARIQREKDQIKASRPADPPHDPETGEVVEDVCHDCGARVVYPEPHRPHCAWWDAPPDSRPVHPSWTAFLWSRPERITDLDRHPAEADA